MSKEQKEFEKDPPRGRAEVPAEAPGNPWIPLYWLGGAAIVIAVLCLIGGGG
jgi:hypothetical protein